MPILSATDQDIPELTALINSAYRGEKSNKGWSTEADLIDGDIRTDEATLLNLVHTPGAVLLKYLNEQNITEGCVYLEKKENRLYLGMLTVSPEKQAHGIGKQLMNAAMMYALEQNCHSIFMRAVSMRDELIAWYLRQGYKITGEREPFPTDNRFGIPRQPLEFVILEKLV